MGIGFAIPVNMVKERHRRGPARAERDSQTALAKPRRSRAF